MSFFTELKRRNVIRVAAAYGVFSWLMLQVGDILFETLELPSPWSKGLLALLAIGVLPALFFSWVYELTPQGIRKESEIPAGASVAQATGRRLDQITIGMVLLALVLVGIDRFLPREQPATAVDRHLPRSVAPVEPDNSIAVLPFTDLSPQQDQGYFSDGMAEEILNVLVRVDALKVASRTSSFAFKGKEVGIPEIAAALKVRSILEGSVRKAGNRVRITAQLIDTQNDRHLWSETFDRELTDIFAIQDEIATAIVASLKSALGIDAQPVHVAVATENPDAYALFLKGRQLFLERSDLAQSIDYLQRSVQLDPGFARAWESLAAVYGTAPGWGVGELKPFLEKSNQAADRALALDPSLVFPWSIKGSNMVNVFPPDWEQVMRWHRRSLQGDAKNATAWLWHGIALDFMGYGAAARSDYKHCLALDPAYENCRAHLMLLDLRDGRPDAAVAWLDHQLSEVTSRLTIYFPYLVPAMVKIGHLRTAHLLADDPRWGFNGNSQFIEAWIQALLHPRSKDHQARLLRYLPANSIADAAPLLIPAGAYARIKAGFVTASVMWLDSSRTFRHSDDFKRVIRDSHIETYWRAHGFPPRCRPLGDNDFECD